MKLHLIVLLLLSLPFSLIAQKEIEEDQGVYEYVVSPVKMSFSQASKAIETVCASTDLVKIISKHSSQSPDGCAYRARVYILFDSLYAEQLYGYNSTTAPFALFDRVNLFEDENGLHLSIVNPDNILRTVLMEDEKYIRFADAHKQKLRSLISSGLEGLIVHKQYGEIRDEGYIGRTMGVMAGGDFNTKIETLAAKKNCLVSKAVEAIISSAKENKGEWNIKADYQFIWSDKGLAIIGFSSPAVESTSFEIVKEGSDDSREDFTCPGIAHAAAYPFQVVVIRSGSGVQVKMVEAMYRMKLFFEDAGMIAFAKNMTMPGSIQDEVEILVKNALK